MPLTIRLLLLFIPKLASFYHMVWMKWKQFCIHSWNVRILSSYFQLMWVYRTRTTDTFPIISSHLIISSLSNSEMIGQKRYLHVSMLWIWQFHMETEFNLLAHRIWWMVSWIPILNIYCLWARNHSKPIRKTAHKTIEYSRDESNAIHLF